jgi:putative mRNA 3-end processing factor
MLLSLTDRGLYCAAGDFHVDPWRPAPRAVITHAHSDHARWGCDAYLAARAGEHVLRTRLGADARIRSVGYGETVDVNGVRVSLHPAGHILGSAQVRIEHGGEVAVVSGDYKTEPDATCAAFESIRCHAFVTESTFGLPIYRWPAQQAVFADIRRWWRQNAERGRASIIFAYALGKAQRLLAGLTDADIGPILTHGAVERLNDDYRASGIALPPTVHASRHPRTAGYAGALVIAPPSAAAGPWLRRFAPYATAFASGWMHVRSMRRRRSAERGFVVSDHVDWPALLGAVEATGAETVWVTHGYREPLVRVLRDRGIDALAVQSRWEGELDIGDDDAVSDAAGEAGNDESGEATSS